MAIDLNLNDPLRTDPEKITRPNIDLPTTQELKKPQVADPNKAVQPGAEEPDPMRPYDRVYLSIRTAREEERATIERSSIEQTTVGNPQAVGPAPNQHMTAAQPPQPNQPGAPANQPDEQTSPAARAARVRTERTRNFETAAENNRQAAKQRNEQNISSTRARQEDRVEEQREASAADKVDEQDRQRELRDDDRTREVTREDNRPRGNLDLFA